MDNESMDSVRERLAEFGRVQVQEFSVEDTDYADQGSWIPVNASGLTESVCVSALDTTCKESKLTTYLKEL